MDKEYWGDTGHWVMVAIASIEEAINSVLVTKKTVFGDWIEEVINEVEAAHERFRTDEEDPDGYGSATFSGALGRIYELQDCHLEELGEAEK
jgi:hypothetical protein